jgi:hypothetical protein
VDRAFSEAWIAVEVMRVENRTDVGETVCGDRSYFRSSGFGSPPSSQFFTFALKEWFLPLFFDQMEDAFLAIPICRMHHGSRSQ